MKNRIGSILLLAVSYVFGSVLPVLAASGETGNLAAGLPKDVQTTLFAVTVMILIDAVLGILLSIQNGRFRLVRLPMFLGTGILPFIGGLLLLYVAALPANLELLFFVVAAAALVKYIIDVKNKVIGFFEGAVPRDQQMEDNGKPPGDLPE